MLSRKSIHAARNNTSIEPVPSPRQQQLAKKVNALETEIRILEEGFGTKEMFGPSVDDQLRENKARLLRVRAKLALLRGDTDARDCTNSACKHRNEPDARFCSSV